MYSILFTGQYVCLACCRSRRQAVELIWTAAGPVDKPRLSFEHRRQLVNTQRFTPEFKEEAVKLVRDRGYGVPEVAARIGVSAHSLYKWVKASSPDKSEGLTLPPECPRS